MRRLKLCEGVDAVRSEDGKWLMAAGGWVAGSKINGRWVVGGGEIGEGAPIIGLRCTQDANADGPCSLMVMDLSCGWRFE